MELKGYLRIMIAKRWIFLVTFFITLGAVLMLTGNQIPVYESVATYVVKANLPERDVRALVSALDLLKNDQIERTIAQVAKSQTIRSQTASRLELTSRQMADFSVNSRVLPGTDIVEIVVQGPDPALARGIASEVGPLTAAFLQGPNWVYALVMLDQPTSPSSPTQPKWMFNLLLGTVAALALGAGMAVLFAYLQEPAENKALAAKVAAARRADQPVTGLPAPVRRIAAKAALTESPTEPCSCPICSGSVPVAAEAALTESATEKRRKP